MMTKDFIKIKEESILTNKDKEDIKNKISLLKKNKELKIKELKISIKNELSPIILILKNKKEDILKEIDKANTQKRQDIKSKYRFYEFLKKSDELKELKKELSHKLETIENLFSNISFYAGKDELLTKLILEDHYGFWTIFKIWSLKKFQELLKVDLKELSEYNEKVNKINGYMTEIHSAESNILRLEKIYDLISENEKVFLRDNFLETYKKIKA